MHDFLDRLSRLNVYPEKYSNEYYERLRWAESAQEVVYNSLKRQFVVKDERNTNSPLRLSALGKPAMELVCQKFFLGHEEADINWRTRSIFYQGDTFEGFINFLLKSVGFAVLEEQTTVEWHGVLGHTDSIVLDEETGQKWLLEFKTMNSKKFTRIKNGGMDIPEYLTQMATYMAATGLPGAWVCVNKDNSELMVIIANKEELEPYLNRAKYIVDCFDNLIDTYDDAFKYFRTPELEPIMRGQKRIGWKVPDNMRWSAYVDKLYYAKPMKFYIAVEAPFYKAPDEYVQQWVKGLGE